MTRFALDKPACFLGTVLATCLLAFGARADVHLAGVYGDHMVLQREEPLRIWGSAEAGEKVTVKLAGQTVSTLADAQGKWQVVMKPLKASAVPVEFIVSGSNTVTVSDVLVGDVWLCSGQSNMVYPMAKDDSAREEKPKANYPLLRLTQVSNRAQREPLAERPLRWETCTPESAAHFSAVGYFFGREVQQSLGVPVGLICSAVAGTPAQCWTSLEALKSDAAFQGYMNLYQTNQAKPAPTNAPMEAVPGTPASLFNGMIAPLTSLRIRGVAWYQGESNTSEAEIYRKLFPALIQDWRKQWNEPKMPFLFVQLPPFGRRTGEVAPSQWAELREAQARTLALPYTGMAVTIDLGKARNILHPTNKREVGRRLGRVALAQVYQQKLEVSGPVFKGCKFKAGKAMVSFRNVGAGLSIGTPVPSDSTQAPAAAGLTLKGFCLAGADHKWVRAQAVLEGDAVIVSSEKVATPLEVSYGWEENPEVNLYNKAGLPAAPFRASKDNLTPKH